jgi:hypothetical protein
MELKNRIDQALKDALREKNELVRDAVRMLLAAMKNKEKELRRPPEDSEIERLIVSQIKQRKDSSEQFRKGGRPELAEKEEAEICVLERFLPEQLGPEELDRLIGETIVEVGAASPRDLGKVMKALTPKVTGRADGKLVSDAVRRKLGA